MILNGAKTVDVKLMLGHKNITSTQVYQHVNDIKKKYNLINKFYKGENVKA
jgi:site-specific recombinase XerD